MNKIRESAQAWEEEAIAECRKDPKLLQEEADGDLCIPCMMPHPCDCDWRTTLREMRKFYDANKSNPPVLNLSWGEKGDGLMDGLYRIATERHGAEIKRLRAKK